MIIRRSMVRHNRGLTLVELMVAMLLSLLLAAGAFTIFSATKQASITQQDLARMQENMRFTITEMINRISAAGYMGCARSMIDGNANLTSTVAVNSTANASWMPDFTVPISATNGASGAPDTLTLVYADAEYPIRVASQASQSAPLSVWRDKNYEKHLTNFNVNNGSVMVVGDCERSAVFKLTNGLPAGAATASATATTPVAVASMQHSTPGNTSAGIEHVFGDKPAWARKLEAVRFFLATKSVGGKTISSLKMRKIGQQLSQADELIEGVEDFQVQFGIDDSPFDGSADRYVDWSASLPLRRISSVRVTLRVNGGRPVTDASGKADQDVDVLRDVVFTVKLRNQVGEFL